MPFHERVAANPDDLIEKVQVVVMHPGRSHPRSRHHRCWRCWGGIEVVESAAGADGEGWQDDRLAKRVSGARET